jgi:WD40 repeat protein
VLRRDSSDAPETAGRTYRAFMSYSHAVDGKLAPALQTALQQFAKPWYRLRAIRIFRDNTSLSVTDRLWTSIEQALQQSDFFILLASPRAATSEWVNREVAWWLGHRSIATLFIAVTESELAWSAASGDFEVDAHGPLPPALRGAFHEEPRWTDLRFAKQADQLALDHPQFSDSVADLAAALHGRPKDEIIGEEVRQHQRLRRITRAVGATLALLAAAAATLGLVARAQRDQAIGQRRVARQQRDLAILQRNKAVSFALTTAAASQIRRRIDVSLLLSLEAYRLRPAAETRGGMLSSLEAAERSGASAILHGQRSGVWSVAFSPDGRTLASASHDGMIRLWDVRTRKLVGRPLVGAKGRDAFSVAFSPDGHTLAAGGGDGVVHLWDLGTQKRLGHVIFANGAVDSLAFSPDGGTLASGGDAGVQLWNPTTGKQAGKPLTGFRGIVETVAFSLSGRALAAGSYEGTIQIWNMATHERRGSPIHGHHGPIRSVAFSPDGRTLASGGDDGTIRLWRVATGEQAGSPLGGRDGPVWSVAFSRDGRTLASGGDDAAIRLWDVGSERPLGQPLTGHSDVIHAVAFSPDGRTLASGGDDTTIRLWPISRLSRLGQPLIQEKRVFESVAFSPDGQTLAATGDDRAIHLWRVATREPIDLPLDSERAGTTSVAFDPEGRILAAAGTRGTVRLWNLATGKLITELRSRSGSVVRSVTFSHDGRTLAAAEGRSGIRLWDMTTYEPRDNSRVDAWSIAVGPDHSTVAAGDSLGGLALWNSVSDEVRTGPHFRHDAAIESVAFRPGGRTLASASRDGTIRFWAVERQKPKQVGQLGESQFGRTAGHSVPVQSIAFSPDGRILASGMDDGTIRLWDVSRHERLGQIGRPLTGHKRAVYSVAFSPDGRTLASAGDDGTVRLWEGVLWSSFGDLQTRVCSIVGPGLSRQEWAEYAVGAPYRDGCA